MTISDLEKEVIALRRALVTLTAWMTTSANSPIRADEAKKIIEIAEGKAK